MLVCIDAFGKWVKLFRIGKKESGKVWDVLYSHMFTRFGLPLELKYDRGLEFIGMLSVYSKEYGIKVSHISVQHSFGSGRAERYV